MSAFETQPNVHGITEVSLRAQFSAINPVTDDRYAGEVIVTLRPAALQIEYVSFGEYIRGFDEEDVPADELTREIFDTIKETIAPNALRVEIDVQSASHVPVWCKIEEGY